MNFKPVWLIYVYFTQYKQQITGLQHLENYLFIFIRYLKRKLKMQLFAGWKKMVSGFSLSWGYCWLWQCNEKESSRITDPPVSSAGFPLSVRLWKAALLPEDRLLAWQVAASRRHRSRQHNCHSEAESGRTSSTVCMCVLRHARECVHFERPAAGSSRWVRSVITELSGRRRVFGRSGWRWRNSPEYMLGNYQQ